ncbi:ATP-binding protein [Pseudomonas sp. S07E 245]|uniref:AAA family ATPase n=1 Tax=Pseudomonas sp. S07E 245 TaxID=2866278 RepID=UPI001C7326AE|nr:AAA family ATPase [Pseudomonas sp. S07E 245]QYX54864.1 ATP-binding protein [Pseudomonas sp. S07E 245]
MDRHLVTNDEYQLSLMFDVALGSQAREHFQRRFLLLGSTLRQSATLIAPQTIQFASSDSKKHSGNLSMGPQISKIFGQIPNTENFINLDLNGKNLLITGSNGSGKTWLLKHLEQILHHELMMPTPSIKELQAELDSLKAKGDPEGRGDNYYEHIRNTERIEQALSRSNHRILIDRTSNASITPHEFSMFFEATRQASIPSPSSIGSVTTSKAQWRSSINGNSVGGVLEQHLSNLKQRAATAIAYDKDEELAKRIENWFSILESNIGLLMEDDSTKLLYDSEKYTFVISRNNKRDTDLQSLSSGYSSIFSIYSEILMRTEVLEITPSDYEAVAFIDEIETHLHVSLQRLILPFLTNTFPKVQFIVTTHSPFIITSTTDAIAYDISTNSVVDEDLSLYPYTAVMKGLLHTKPTSIVLEGIIKNISTIINSNSIDTIALHSELSKLRDSYEILDNRSKNFYMRGEQILLDAGENDVQS